jgi:hypothetical protein
VRKEKRMIVNNNKMQYISAGRGHNDMYWKLLNNEGGRDGVRESNTGVELTKMKYIHNWDTSRNPFEH